MTIICFFLLFSVVDTWSIETTIVVTENMQICHELSCKHGLFSSLPAPGKDYCHNTQTNNTQILCDFCATLCLLQAFAILSEAKDEHTRKRRFLLSLYNDTEQCVKVIDHNILPLLQSKVGNIEENIKKHKLQLAREEYFLLVAGNEQPLPSYYRRFSTEDC